MEDRLRKLKHDIGSNQQIVTNFLRLLEKKYPDGEAKEFIDIVIKANKKAQVLMTELLNEFGDDDAGKVNISVPHG